ncbi:MAG: hypothetical protein ACKVQW_13635 [Pyrinomonadaceae bacterium]
MTNFLITAALIVFGLAASVCAQDKATNFGGTWNLDVAKSKLGDRNTIEAQTMTVTQTDTDIKVETKTTRKAPPEGAPPPGGGRPGGGMGGGMMGGGDMATTYALDGKETKTEVQTQMGAMTTVTKAKLEGGKFMITRTTQTPMGDRTSTETWSLGTDGKTLTVESTRPNRDGGTDTTTRVFNKG